MQKSDYVFERLVTKAEADKGHITIIASHHERFKKTFGPIHPENETKGKTELAFKPFFIEKATAPVELKLVFRSPSKNGKPRNELRLYFNKGKGQFKPSANEIIIALFYGNKVVLGVRPSGVKDAKVLNAKIKKAAPPAYEADDISHSPYSKHPKKTKKAAYETWKRDSSTVLECLKKARYTCEAGFTGPSFIAKKTEMPYLEVHHLVPLSYQDDLATFNLNDPANLFALSPHAHRQIHYGMPEDVRSLVKTLLARRPALRTQAKLPEDTILDMYKCL